MAEDYEYIDQVLDTGSASAYYKLVEKYQNQVFTMCYRIIKNREEAEEAAQDVFVKCFKTLLQLKDKEKFPNWLMKIAYSCAIDYVRRKKVIKIDLADVETDLPSDTETPLAYTSDLDRMEFLEKAISVLERNEAAVISLYYLEDMPVKEIADITGLSVSNVKVKLFRARESLKQQLSKILKEEIKDIL